MRMSGREEKTIEDALIELFEDQEALEGTIFENCETETFKGAELLTNDKGVVLYLANGTKINLTIQAYD